MQPSTARSPMVSIRLGRVVSASMAGTPTSTVRPPRRVSSQATRWSSARPTTSKTTSALIPWVSSRTSRAASSAVTAWVAPMRSAACRRDSTGSTATMVEAPASRQPWMTLRPTPPQPITTTRSPGWTWAVRIAAPTPVVTPQPTRAAISKGTSSGIGTTALARSTVACAKVAALRPWKTVPPSMWRRVVPSSIIPLLRTPLRQSWGWPWTQ